jgi:hypothetical protein
VFEFIAFHVDVVANQILSECRKNLPGHYILQAFKNALKSYAAVYKFATHAHFSFVGSGVFALLQIGVQLSGDRQFD